MKEKLQEYALIAEIISAIAIVLSLIFVGLQVKQGSEETAANTEAIRSQVRESMLNEDTTLLGWSIEYPGLLDLHFDPASKDQATIRRYTAYFYALARTRENYWVQHRNGILDTQTYLSYRNTFLAYLGSDFYLNIWKSINDTFVPGFVDEINKELVKRGRLKLPNNKR